MAKNCWEHKNCGRQAGGAHAVELGVCKAASESKFDQINKGKNGGRACFAVAGTLCGGRTQGTYANKIQTCTSCDFYIAVKLEEGTSFLSGAEIVKKFK